MTYDDAMAKAVLGDKVRHDGMTSRSYIFYNFKGFYIQFVFENGQLGSSSLWAGPFDKDKEADWHVVGGPDIEAWPDFVQTNWDVDLAPNVVDTPLDESNTASVREDSHEQAAEEPSGWAIFRGG